MCVEITPGCRKYKSDGICRVCGLWPPLLCPVRYEVRMERFCVVHRVDEIVGLLVFGLPPPLREQKNAESTCRHIQIKWSRAVSNSNFHYQNGKRCRSRKLTGKRFRIWSLSICFQIFPSRCISIGDEEGAIEYATVLKIAMIQSRFTCLLLYLVQQTAQQLRPSAFEIPSVHAIPYILTFCPSSDAMSRNLSQ